MKRHACMLLLAACSGSSSPTPTATFTALDHAMVGEAIAFDAAGSKSAAGYGWDFGDGAHGGGGQIAHVFSSAGTYTVKLTVAASGGKTASDTLDITIVAPAPGPMTPVVGVVRDPTGAAISGVNVQEGTVTTTSDADGNIRLMLTADPHVLSLTKDGYSTHFQALDLRNALSGYFEATMQTREPTQPLDAGKGGTLKGKDGSTFKLPAGALVDSSGTPVSGMVDIALTPVNVTDGSSRDAFPGRFDGIAPDATRTPIMSLGTVDYALEQNGQRLQLAPGRTASIDIPIYPTLDVSGNTLKAGDTIPLWSLDEKSGSWVQEGTGTVTSSADVPNQLGLHAEVGHFSWWNGDSPMPNPDDITLKCTCQSDEEICAMFGKSAYTCHIYSALQDTPAPASAATASPYFKQEVDFVGQGIVTAPGNFNIQFRASALGGTIVGTASTQVQPGQTITVALAPKAGVQVMPDQAVTLPYIQPVANSLPFTKYRYLVHVPDGALSAAYQAEIGSTGGLRLLDTSGTQLASALFDSQSGALSYSVSAGDYVVELIMLTVGSGQLTLRAGNITDQTLTVPFDAPVSLVAGDEERIHFAATAGQMLDLKWQSGGAASIGILTIDAPDGTQLFTNDKLDTSFDWPIAAVDGNYVVTVQAINNVSGTLHVSLPGQVSDGGVPSDGMIATDDGMSSGDMASGGGTVQSISLPFKQAFDTSAQQKLGFTVAAGTGVMIQAFGGDGSSGAVRVKTAGGTLLGSFNMFMASINAPFHPFYLAAGGNYVVEVDPPAPYTQFSVDIEPVTDIRPVNSRAQMPVTISTTTGSVGFTFNANTGDPVYLSMTGGGCSQGSGYYQDLVFAEQYYTSTAPHTIATTSGTQLAVMTKTGNGCGNDYLFSVRAPIEITPGSPSSAFTVGGTGNTTIEELFNFSATQNTLYCGKITSMTQNSNEYFSITAGNGTAGTYAAPYDQYVSDFGPFNANSDGAQPLIVDGLSVGSSDTVIWTYVLPTPSPVPDPTAITATMLRPGEQKWYSFVSDPTDGSNWASGKTTFTVTYQTLDINCTGTPCNGKAIVYQDNGSRFYQATFRIWSYAGSYGGANNISGSAATIPSSGATTWYVQLTPDPRHFAPIPTPAPYAFTASWKITPAP